jgi:hypothetical protein
MSGFLLLLVKELLAAGSLLAGTSSSSLLAGVSGSSLLVGASGLLIKELLAMALIRPQVVDCPLPILVGAFRAGAGPMKNGPPGRFWRQQASGLLVFAQGATNLIVWGVADPVGSAWGRL